MATRPRDRVYVRFIGPADRLRGEYRGQPVELLDDTAEAGALVRFPDGSASVVHRDHLTDALFRLP